MNILDTITTPWWLRALPYVAGATIVTCGLIFADMHGHSVEREHWQRVIAQNDADNAREIANREAAARREEQGKAETLRAIDKQTLQDKQNEIDSRDRTIADLHAGTVRLRDRFTCAAASDQRVPSAAATTGQRDAASAGGLQEEDGVFLVSESSRADQVARQLQACQAVVRADRGQN